MLANRVRMGSGSEKFDPSTWKGIQNIVRKGKTTDFFSVGDELISNYDGSPITLQVIGINNDTPTDSRYTHSMTLQTKDCLESRKWNARDDNRYINSDIRTYLNGVFLNKLDTELASVLGAVDKKVAVRNAIGGQDSFSDKVFLLSRLEVDLGTEGITAGEFVYPYYDGITRPGRIKQLNGSNRIWWLRSPNVSSLYTVRCVNSNGSLDYYFASDADGISPACVII